MALKPEQSLAATLAVMAVDIGIFQTHVSSVSDVKNSPPHNSILASGTSGATWTSVSMCAALSLLARDPNIFIFGAGFAVVLSFYYQHANLVHPGTGQVTYPPAGGPVPGGVS